MTSKLASALSLAFLGSLFLVPACASAPQEKEELVESTAQDLSLRDTRIVGSLSYGQTSPSTAYTRTPRYRAYKFSGNTGDEVDIWVKSNSGDPVTFLLDNNWRIIASNDDAPGTTNSHIKTKLPANASATRYIVVRDYYLDPMTFKVELKGGTADLTAGCNVDADCVKIPAQCCDLGAYTSVKAGNEAAYRAKLGCSEPTICPAVMPKPTPDMAQCNVGTHKCELVKPKDIACGGFTVNPHQCPARYSCVYPEPTHDVPGKCRQFCGGIAAFPCDDPAEECVDNPDDSCNPATGGADCGGICMPKVTPPPPPPPADCRSTGCAAGRFCSFCWGSFACIPNGAMC
jgi:hypothetical protein